MNRTLLKAVELGNGETLGYREREGGNKVLLLVHGNMTSSKHWDVVLDKLDSEYKVYAVDLRGFGVSTYHRPIESLTDFAEDLKLFVDALGVKKFSLLGWSTGGGVAMSFAATYPDYVEKLLLLASLSTRGYPFYKLDQSGQPVERIKSKTEMREDPFRTVPIQAAYDTKNKVFLKGIWNSLIYTQNQPSADQYDEYLEDMCTQRNLVDIYYANNIYNISHQHNGLTEGTGAIDHIQAPTCVLWGENDLVVSKDMTQEIVEDLGEKAELRILTNCGHSPLIDDLDLFLHEVTSFLKK